MRKKIFGRQLNRTKNQRKALFRGLISSLIENGELLTTLAKARAIKAAGEKLITKAKRGSLLDRQLIFKTLNQRALVNKLTFGIAPLFQEKKGGYLRIVPLGFRRGDGAKMAKVLFTREVSGEIIKPKEEEDEPKKSEEETPEKNKEIKTKRK